MLEAKTYRGTWDEIASHKDELPPNAMLEMRVVSLEPEAEEGKNLYERFSHLFGTVKDGPTDMAEHPEKYMQGFGETKAVRTLKP